MLRGAHCFFCSPCSVRAQISTFATPLRWALWTRPLGCSFVILFAKTKLWCFWACLSVRCRNDGNSHSRVAWRSLFVLLPMQRGSSTNNFCNTSAAKLAFMLVWACPSVRCGKNWNSHSHAARRSFFFCWLPMPRASSKSNFCDTAVSKVVIFSVP